MALSSGLRIPARICSEHDQSAKHGARSGEGRIRLVVRGQTERQFAARGRSLFSIKAVHWRDAIRGTKRGARGKEQTARQRRVIDSRFSAIDRCRRHACLYSVQQNPTWNFKHQTSGSTNLLYCPKVAGSAFVTAGNLRAARGLFYYSNGPKIC